MFIVHVFIHVKSDCIEEFICQTIENAQANRKEPGVVSFDVLQQTDDLTRFVLLERYQTEEDAISHRETAHFNSWIKVAEPLLIEPRTRVNFQDVILTDAC